MPNPTATAPRFRPCSMRCFMSAISASVAARFAASPVGRNVTGSFIAAMRAARCPTLDGAGGGFEFKRARDPVHRFEAKVFFVLTVLVQVDEARRDDKTARVDR